MSPRHRARRSHDAPGGGSDLHVGRQRRHQFSSALNLDGGSRGVKQKVEFSSQPSLYGAHKRGRRRSRTPTRQRTLAFDTSCQPTRRRLPRSGTSRGIEPRPQRVLETRRLPTATTQSAERARRSCGRRESNPQPPTFEIGCSTSWLTTAREWRPPGSNRDMDRV